LSRIPASHHAIQHAARGHAAGSSPLSAAFLFLLPALAMCAVRVPLPEDLFNSDFRARLRSVFSEHHSIADLTIQPMRRRPGSRHVFSYKLLLSDKRTGKSNVVELVGKQDTTRAVGKAAKEFEAMRLLWSAGFGQDNRYRIPQPLHHFEDLRMIIQERARGTKLRSFLGDGSDASLNYARMTGQWLAKLHNLPLETPRPCSYEAEKASLRLFVDALCNDRPELEAELRRYAAAIEERFNCFEGAASTHVHGDFHPDHIYVADKFITVIDFERFCIGDPARDLGSFAGHVRTTAYSLEKSIESADQEMDAFLQSYFGAMPETEGNAISARVAPYAALSSLEALYYVASVLKVTNPSRIAIYVQCVRESAIPLLGTESRSANTGAQKASA
jgi:aminoglycoside phosphotransferase (APT) family kinase protein